MKKSILLSLLLFLFLGSFSACSTDSSEATDDGDAPIVDDSDDDTTGDDDDIIDDESEDDSDDDDSSDSEPATYAVSGVASGLDGDVTLLLNNSEELVVQADGAFVFTTSFDSADDYAVVISDYPSITQNCSLANATGTIAATDITNITVTCVAKAWSHPQDLSASLYSFGDQTINPQMAMNAAGDAVLCWEGYDDISADYKIFISEYRDGVWSHPSADTDAIDISSGSQYCDVAIDAAGNSIVVWQDNGTPDAIFISEYRNGAWSHPDDAADKINPDGSSGGYPQVAMDDNGNALIVWIQSDGVRPQVFMSEYRSGTWNHPDDLNDFISVSGLSANDNFYAPGLSLSVKMDNAGNAIIAWLQRSGSYDQVYLSEYRVGSWNHPDDANDHVNPENSTSEYEVQSCYLSLTMDDQENAILAWNFFDGISTTQIYTSEYRNGIWEHPADVNDTFLGATDPTHINVTSDDNGDAILLWRGSDGATLRIFMSEYRNGSWSAPTAISPEGSDPSSPHGVMDNSGNAMIVWQQSDGSNSQLFMSEYRDGAWVHPATISDYFSLTDFTAGGFDLAISDNGDAKVFWEVYDDENFPYPVLSVYE